MSPYFYYKFHETKWTNFLWPSKNCPHCNVYTPPMNKFWAKLTCCPQGHEVCTDCMNGMTTIGTIYYADKTTRKVPRLLCVFCHKVTYNIN